MTAGLVWIENSESLLLFAAAAVVEAVPVVWRWDSELDRTVVVAGHKKDVETSLQAVALENYVVVAAVVVGIPQKHSLQ